MTTEADRMARKAANRLEGTCQSIHDLGEEFEALQNDINFCRTLDSLVFCCRICDWWCGMDEANDCDDGFACDDCMSEGDCC